MVLIGAGTCLAGLLAGWLLGAWQARRKFRAQAEDVRGEVMRLRAVATDKLSGDDPDLDKLIDNFQSAASSAYDAIRAMEHQVTITKLKSEGSRQVIASSAEIIRMIEERAGLDDDAIEITPKTKPPGLTAKKKP